jgi:HEAT repeat protein
MNQDSPISPHCAHYLRKIDTTIDVRPRLIELLDHEDARIRSRAADELAEVADEECLAAIPRLIDLLRDQEPSVRYSAAGAMMRAASPEDAVNALKRAFVRETEEYVRRRMGVMLLHADWKRQTGRE